MENGNGFIQRVHTYTLTFPASALTGGGGSSQQSFIVETLYDFWLFKQSAFVYDSNGLGVSTLQWPFIAVLMQDGATQQQLVSAASPIASLFGTGQLPYVLPQPHMVSGGATFNVTATNNHASTAFTAVISFTGVHVAKGARPNRERIDRARRLVG